MPQMLAVDLLIFDLDGTLADTRQDLANSVNYSRLSLNLPPLQVEEVMRYVGDGLTKLIERSLPVERHDQINKAIEYFRCHYRTHLLDHSRFYPGVEDVLKHFRQKKMAILSNKPEEFSKSIAKGLGIENFFSMILGGDSLPAKKPDPGPILHIIDKLKVQPSKAVIIGDGTTDILAGKRAHVWTCAVTYGFKEKAVLLQAQPDFILNDILQLPSIII